MDPRQKYAQWLRIALSEKLTRLGAFLASRRKHSRLPKRRASLKIIRWRESKKSRLCQWVKDRSQNHVELYWTFLALRCFGSECNPLNAELNSICHLLALLEAHFIFHVSRLRVNIVQNVHLSLLNSLYPEPTCYCINYILGRASNVFNNAVSGMILNCEKRNNRRNAYPSHFHFVHHKSLTNWPVIGDIPPEPWHGQQSFHNLRPTENWSRGF